MSTFENIFGDYFNAYKQTSRARDENMLDIALYKKDYEKNLDDMWAIYIRGNPAQLAEYNKGLNQIKEAGFKVLRNSAGKHMIRG